MRDPRPTSNTQQVLESIRSIVRALHISTRAAERVYGLSGAQLFVLQKLREDDGATINQLAERTLTHQSTVSVVVRRLAAHELVNRRTAKDDARKIEVFLTAAGRRLVERAPEAAQQRLIEVLEGLSTEKRTKLACLLGEVVIEAGFALTEPPLFFEDEEQPSK